MTETINSRPPQSLPGWLRRTRQPPEDAAHGRDGCAHLGGEYQTALLAPLGGALYQANLPAPGCSAVPEYYVSATGDQGGTTKFPRNAPADVLSSTVATITSLFTDDFQTAHGWTVSNDLGLVTGAWQRAVPAGANGATEAGRARRFGGLRIRIALYGPRVLF